MRMKDKEEIKPDAGRHTRDFDWDQLGQACLTRPRDLPAVSHGKNKRTMSQASGICRFDWKSVCDTVVYCATVVHKE